MSEHLLDIKEVKSKVGLSHTTIYKKMNAGGFPPARKVGENAVRWLESEIDAWIANLPKYDQNAA